MNRREGEFDSDVNVPVIETARLRLRGHRADDFVASAAMWAEPEVTRFIGGRPFTEEETWARLLRYVGHWNLLGFGYWIVEEKATGAFVGEVGFADYKRDIDPPLDGIPEVGWALASAAQGKGYATEAVKAVLGWGDAHFGAVKTVCMIGPQNKTSIRVAEKCGYRPWRKAVYKGKDTVVFQR
jgi:RimJ/RimL family protein N-acetyltransferase